MNLLCYCKKLEGLELNGKLITIKHKSSYRVALVSKDNHLLHQHSFQSLLKAVDLLKKIEQKNEINSEHWLVEPICENQFLIRNRGKKQKAHIWLGKDTACKMWSTGGLKASGFDLHDDPQGKDVCTMCCNAAI